MLPSLDRLARPRLHDRSPLGGRPRQRLLTVGCLLLIAACLSLVLVVGVPRQVAGVLAPTVLLPPMPGFGVLLVDWPAGWLVGLGLAVPAAVVLRVVLKRRR